MYLGFADRKISVISSMQCGMTHIFCSSVSPIKRLKKIKSYECILRSYQSQIWHLRSDLRVRTLDLISVLNACINEMVQQALTISSSSSPGTLSNAGVVTITGGTITDVQGNQTVCPSCPVCMMLTTLFSDLSETWNSQCSNIC